MKKKPFMDVVIPIAVKDLPKLSICLNQIYKNSLTPINKIYIVTKEEICQKKLKLEQSVIWIPEENYPFCLKDIDIFFTQKGNQYKNSSWYYQQLLKFYILDLLQNNFML